MGSASDGANKVGVGAGSAEGSTRNVSSGGGCQHSVGLSWGTGGGSGSAVLTVFLDRGIFAVFLFFKYINYS